jgi:anaphase-promoting complex subunit 8
MKSTSKTTGFIRASELLLSIPASKRSTSQASPTVSNFSTSTPARSKSPRPSISFADTTSARASVQQAAPPSPRHPLAPSLQIQSKEADSLEFGREAQDSDVLATARACVQAREFLRAVHLLRECKSSKARFLSVYSQFMVCQAQNNVCCVY